MYKTLLATLCLLACSAIVHGQRIDRPAQAAPVDINALTQRLLANKPLIQRLREMYPELVRGAPLAQDQNPILKPLGVDLGGLDSSQGEFDPLRGVTQSLNGAAQSLEGVNLHLDSGSQAISALSQLKLIATPSTLTTQPRRPLENSNAIDNEAFVTAQAAANNRSVTRCVKDDHRVIVRMLPGSWYLGSINDKDCFRAKAVWGDQWFFGDVIGNPKLKDVWVLREGFEGGAMPNGKPPSVVFGDESRDKLEEKYASWISPGRADGDQAKLLRKTKIFGNYDPETNHYYDELNQGRQLDPDTPFHEYKVRWITDDGRAAIIRHYDIYGYGHTKSGQEIPNTSQWGIVPCSTLAFFPCHPEIKQH